MLCSPAQRAASEAVPRLATAVKPPSSRHSGSAARTSVWPLSAEESCLSRDAAKAANASTQLTSDSGSGTTSAGRACATQAATAKTAAAFERDSSRPSVEGSPSSNAEGAAGGREAAVANHGKMSVATLQGNCTPTPRTK